MTTITIKDGKNKVRRVVYDEDGEEGGMFWPDYIETFYYLLQGMGFMFRRNSEDWVAALQELEHGETDIKIDPSSNPDNIYDDH
jgi:hypothetical protein